MICENCKNKIDENSKTCPNCGVIVTPNDFSHNKNIIIEQPVINQVIEEEHKNKMTKKNKKQILIITSLIFFALVIGTIVLANFPKEKNNKVDIPVPQLNNSEKNKKINTIKYNNFEVAYESNYEAKIDEGLLLIENKDLYFQLTIHPNVTKDMFEQSKKNLKQLLLDSGYIIESEENTVRSGIEFYLIKLYNIVDNKKSDYEYYISIENNNLFEIMILEKNENSYSDVSKFLRTIIKETKIVN